MKARLMVIIIVLVLILQLLGCWNVFTCDKKIVCRAGTTLAIAISTVTGDLHQFGGTLVEKLLNTKVMGERGK